MNAMRYKNISHPYLSSTGMVQPKGARPYTIHHCNARPFFLGVLSYINITLLYCSSVEILCETNFCKEANEAAISCSVGMPFIA